MGLTRSLAREVGTQGRANVIAPGFVATELTAALSPAAVAKPAIRSASCRHRATRDVGQMVAFLSRPRRRHHGPGHRRGPRGFGVTMAAARPRSEEGALETRGVPATPRPRAGPRSPAAGTLLRHGRLLVSPSLQRGPLPRPVPAHLPSPGRAVQHDLLARALEHPQRDRGQPRGSAGSLRVLGASAPHLPHDRSLLLALRRPLLRDGPSGAFRTSRCDGAEHIPTDPRAASYSSPRTWGNGSSPPPRLARPEAGWCTSCARRR